MKIAQHFKRSGKGRCRHALDETTMLLQREVDDQRRQRLTSKRDRVCARCLGMGYESFFMIAKCDRCNGSGKTWDAEPRGRVQ